MYEIKVSTPCCLIVFFKALKETLVWSTELTYVPDSGTDEFFLKNVVCVYQRQVGILKSVLRCTAHDLYTRLFL